MYIFYFFEVLLGTRDMIFQKLTPKFQKQFLKIKESIFLYGKYRPDLINTYDKAGLQKIFLIFFLFRRISRWRPFFENFQRAHFFSMKFGRNTSFGTRNMCAKFGSPPGTGTVCNKLISQQCIRHQCKGGINTG